MWDRVRIANREVTDIELRKRWRARKMVDDLDDRLYDEVDISDVEEMEEGERRGVLLIPPEKSQMG